MNSIQLRHAVLLGAVCGALLTTTAAAAPSSEENGCALRVATGPTGKVYARAFDNMRDVCGSEVRLCQVPSEGGLKNLNLLAKNEADLGLVQVDTIETVMHSGDEGFASLQAVLPLHANLLHIVVLSAGSLVDVKYVMGVAVPHTGRMVVIRKFSDLRGLRVAAVASAQLTTRMLDQQTGFGLAIEDVNTDDQAMAKLRSGAVQAIFTLGGWPTPLIERLRADAGLMLAEFDGKAQPPYRIVKRSYDNLAQYNVSFMAVPNLIVTRLKPTGAHGRQVADLQRCLVQHLDELQDGTYSPIWREIKDVSETYGIPPFPASPARKAAGR